MSGFTLIDDRDPTSDELLGLLADIGEITLSNYYNDEDMYWKVHLIFHTKNKTHEVNGSGVTAQVALLELWRWAESIIQGEE